jgi:glycosyltransferase involved in cell wall biosynthesis
MKDKKVAKLLRITYLSASIIPSQNANSVHVMKMCNALAKSGHKVVLVGTHGDEKLNYYDYYNVNKDFQLVLNNKINRFSSINRLVNGIKQSKKSDLTYTRWLVGLLGILIFTNKKIIFEYHSHPTTSLQRILEKLVIRSKRVIRHIFITDTLRKSYQKKYNFLQGRDCLVLPDGADIILNTVKEKKSKKLECGYLGSFLPGKGIDVIVKLAEILPDFKFHIIGGKQQEIELAKNSTKATNINWYGYLPQKEAMKVFEKVDIALLPNQKEIFVKGQGKGDIGKWTSPMKLFEYMAMGKGIIASNLEVLKEVLIHDYNSILVNSQKIEEWAIAIKKLEEDRSLYRLISHNAKNDLENKYSWDHRAKKALQNLVYYKEL